MLNHVKSIHSDIQPLPSGQPYAETADEPREEMEGDYEEL